MTSNYNNMWDISVFEVPHNMPARQENAGFVQMQTEQQTH